MSSDFSLLPLSMRVLHVIILTYCLGSGTNYAQPVNPTAADQQRVSIAFEAISRLKGMDLEANPALKGAVLKVLNSVKGTAAFVEIVKDFGLKDQDRALLDYAVAHPAESAGVDALRLVLAAPETASLVKEELGSTNSSRVVALLQALGNTGDKQVVTLAEPLVTATNREPQVRKQAVLALAETQEGAHVLLRLAKEGALPPDTRLAASSALNGVRWPQIKAEAATLLPPPQSASAEPLPAVSELVKRKGDPIRGAEVFRRETVGCNKCHQVNDEGMDFGPKLSEIGSKLGKDALYESILDPSNGISFGYEAWQLELKNGDEAFGLIVSETADEVALKTQNGIVTRYKKAALAKRQMMKTSIMPAGLQQAMKTQELVDLIEYLASLKSGQSGTVVKQAD